MLKIISVLLCVVVSVSTAHAEKSHHDVVLLGGYQMFATDWNLLEKYADIQNSCVSDFSSQQLSWTLVHGVYDYSPKYCVIHTGLEDFLIGVPEERVIKNVKQIIAALKEHSIQVILVDVLTNPASEFNGRSVILNDTLENIAQKTSSKLIHFAKEAQFEAGSMLLTPYAQTKLNLAIIEALNECRATESVPRKEVPKNDFHSMARFRIQRIMSESPAKVKVCMLGNSITEGGKNWNYLVGGNAIRNCGQGGYTSAQMLWHLDTTVIAARPTHCFIMAGINDLSLKIPLWVIKSNYIQIITKLQKAGIQPVIQSTLLQTSGSENNVLVKELNSWLKQYCQERKLDYIDVNTLLSDKDGLRAQNTSDGTHLVPDAYKLWGALLTNYLDSHKIQH